MSPDASDLDGKPNGPAGSMPKSSARIVAFAPLPTLALLVALALAAPVAQPLPWMAPQWGALFWAPAARAVELRGSTYFTRPPWKVTLLSYRTTVGERRASYYFTIELSPEAGAPLARLSIRQTRGADWDFPFKVEQTRAFLGAPRRERRAVPVEAVFNPEQRRFTIEFPQPVAPGETLTVVLRPWHNPMQADTYLFAVTAWPAGPDPVASPVGFGTLRIYNRFTW
jgi:hypothetical protein